MSAAMWACHLDNIEHFKVLSSVDDSDHNDHDYDNEGKTWLHWCVRKKEPLECLRVSRFLFC